MAETVVLPIEKREGRGTKKAVRLRKDNKVPGVLYGHQESTESISVLREDLARAIRLGARVVDLQLGGQVQKVLIREVQYDHLGKEFFHVDFYRISADERIVVEVRIELRGTAPGLAQGGVLDQPMHTLEVECLAIAIPESIRVPVGELQLDQAIHVRDLKLPEGVTAMSPPEAVVVQVTAPVEEPEPGAEEAASAEPEVIGRKKEAEEGEEEKK